MSGWRVPLADVRITDDEIAAVAATYRTGWLSMGPETAAFEEEFAEYVGARHVFAVANGTAGLHLACAAAGLGPGDDVVVPSMTFVATANAVAYTGARPVFADIDSARRPWLTRETVARVLTPRTRAVVHMCYGGHAGDIAGVAALVADQGLLLIEDAAHGVGGRVDARHLGTFGALGAYSFFSNKNLAIGEGGMVVTDSDELAARLRLLRSHGMTTLTWDRHRGHAAAYDVVALGFNYRIDEPRAALGRARLRALDDAIEQRLTLDARYRTMLEDVEGVTAGLAPEEGVHRAAHLFTIVLDGGVDRDAFRASLGEHGVQTSVHYPPVHQFSIYRENGRSLPVTEHYGAHAVTLPLYPHMTEADQDIVVEAVRSAAAKHRVALASPPR
jgi:dTDP-4-amino-4,6-dideoxygalactose transaminase